MADINTEAKATITAEDRTGNTFQEVGKKMRQAEESAGSLSRSFSDLGTIVKGYLGFQAIRQSLQYFAGISSAALEDVQATKLLSSQLVALGQDTEDAGDAIDAHIQKMQHLGQQGGDTTAGLTKLIRATKDVQSAIELSGLAADVAVSQNISYADAVDLMQSVLTGKGVRALKAYGQAIDENATVAQQMAAVQNLVTRTMESAADDTDRQVARMETTWAEFQQQMGLVGVWMANDFARFFNSTLESLGTSSSDWARKIAKTFEVVKYVVLESSPVRKIVDAFTGGGSGRSLKDVLAEFDRNWKSMTEGTSRSSGKLNTDLSRTIDLFGSMGGSADKEADRIKQSFADLSKAIVQSIDEQADAVKDLKADLKDLDQQLADSLEKSDAGFKKKVADIARSAQSRIDEIDKEIAQENATRSAGFRTRIEQLQAEKAKEQDVIRRAGMQVSDIKAEIAKDDLAQAVSEHEQEVAELRAASDKKKAVVQGEIDQRTAFATALGTKAADQGFIARGVSEGTSFAGSVGAGSVQQQIVFQLNGDVVGADGFAQLKKTIIDALNREAVLRGVGGK